MLNTFKRQNMSCQALTVAGTKCKNSAQEVSDFCWRHQKGGSKVAKAKVVKVKKAPKKTVSKIVEKKPKVAKAKKAPKAKKAIAKTVVKKSEVVAPKAKKSKTRQGLINELIKLIDKESPDRNTIYAFYDKEFFDGVAVTTGGEHMDDLEVSTTVNFVVHLLKKHDIQVKEIIVEEIDYKVTVHIDLNPPVSSNYKVLYDRFED